MRSSGPEEQARDEDYIRTVVALRGAGPVSSDHATNDTAERIAAHARKVADEAPPVSDAQRAKIAAVLMPSGNWRRPPAMNAEKTAMLRRDRGLRRAQRAAREALACVFCGAAPESHGLGHAWEPKSEFTDSPPVSQAAPALDRTPRDEWRPRV